MNKINPPHLKFDLCCVEMFAFCAFLLLLLTYTSVLADEFPRTPGPAEYDLSELRPICRFYNNVTERHALSTLSLNVNEERGECVSIAGHDTVGSLVDTGYIYRSSQPGTTELYALYNGEVESVYITSSEEEKQLVTAGFNYIDFPSIGHIFTGPGDRRVELHRLENYVVRPDGISTYTHLYTSDATEIAILKANGWTDFLLGFVLKIPYYEWNEPESAVATMFLIHGGGFFGVGIDKVTSDNAYGDFAIDYEADLWESRGWRTLSVDYRAYRKSLTDVLWFYDQLPATTSDPKVCSTGQSAGGALSLLVAAKR